VKDIVIFTGKLQNVKRMLFGLVRDLCLLLSKKKEVEEVEAFIMGMI